VLIIDTDEEACQQAEKENIRSILSSAFDEDALEAAGVGSAGTFLAMTSNAAVNLGVAQRAVEEFEPPRVLAVFPRDPQANTLQSKKIGQAFDPDLADVTLKTWNQYLLEGSVKLGMTRLRYIGLDLQKAHLRAMMRSREFIPLIREREGGLQVISATDEWMPNDKIIYLLHDPKPKLLKRLSGGLNQSASQTTLVVERLPAVEEVPIVIETPPVVVSPPPHPGLKTELNETRPELKPDDSSGAKPSKNPPQTPGPGSPGPEKN
jgi:hypothetical protein